MDYKKSGVDIDLADTFVERIKKLVGRTYDQRTISAVGGFAALYKMDEDRFIAASTDGVGTKIKLAIDLGIHDTIGIDLVAMCVNDLICTGARPLFFLDYFACSKLDLNVSEKVITGIVEGCMQSKMALIGGETAQMPSMYHNNDYDLAGFAIGEVNRAELIDGLQINAGDELVGISSSGFHSNGFSLIRKLIDDKNDDLKKACLTPTKIYVSLIQEIKKKMPGTIKGLAHITGSGFLNIPRMNEKFNYHIKNLPKEDEIPVFMSEVFKMSKLSQDQLLKTFNMGVGLVIATSNAQNLLKALHSMGEKAWILGEVSQGNGELILS